MSSPNATSREVKSLIAALCNETLDGAQFERLETILREDEAARAMYRRYMNLHVALDLYSRAERGTTGTPASRTKPAGRSRLGRFWRHATGTLTKPTNQGLVVATVMLVGCLVLMALVAAPSFREWNARNDAVQPPSAGAVAQLTQMVAARWADGTKPKAVGDSIVAKEPLRLAEGLVEIKFAQGATVILEGPATFIPLQQNASKLDHGRLIAQVPEKAVGFSVETPSATITDLGTEFGLSVQGDGAAEVCVTQGTVMVEAAPGAPQKKPTVCVLVGGQTAQVAAGKISQVTPEQATHTQRDFVRLRRLIPRASAFDNKQAVTLSFRQGIDDYQGVADTHIRADLATSMAEQVDFWVDTDATGGTRHDPAHSLLRFDRIVGNGPNQIPPGSTVLVAVLTLTTSAENDCAECAALVNFYRMAVPWKDSDTWKANFGGDGLTVGTDTAAKPDARLTDALGLGVAQAVNVTASVQAWVNGEKNHGWAILPTSGDGWVVASSEAPVAEHRPMLSVTFIPKQSKQESNKSNQRQ